MYYSLYFKLTLISLILLTASHCIVANEAIEESQEAFPEDFKHFLKGLSLVSHKRDDADATTTKISTFGTTRPEVLLSSQKAALRDMLMMKLVSYYEDKYRVSHHVTTGRPGPGPGTGPPEPIGHTQGTGPGAQLLTERNVRGYNPSAPAPAPPPYDDTREKYSSEVAEIVVI